jgi:hypothetical protein
MLGRHWLRWPWGMSAMDRITASLLDGFRTERGLDSLPRSELFESFAGYCVLSSEYRPARYQLLMAMRRYVHGDTPVPQVAKHCEAYCLDILREIWDPHDSEDLTTRLLPAINFAVSETEGDGVLDRDTVRTQQFTDLVKTRVDRMRPGAVRSTPPNKRAPLRRTRRRRR